MNKNKKWFKIVVYIMVISMFLSTLLFSLTWLMT